MADQTVHPAIKPGTDPVRFQINGREVVGYKGESIINVAAREGFYVPHYCWHPSLTVAGNCRLCLVEVHMPNPRDAAAPPMPLPKPVIACQTPITPGMLVFTESQLAKECQNGMMEFLLVNHPLDCPICDRGGECQLQRYSMEYGKGHTRMADQKRKFKKPQLDPLIDIERNRCIMCTRCVRFCDEVAGEHVMGVFDRGEGNYIGTFGRGPVAHILSGNVIDICPVGCLTSKPFRFKARVWELFQTQSTSIWDASGAKVTHWTRNGKLYRTTPPSRKYHDRYTVNEDTEEFIDNLTRFGSDFSLHRNRWDESRMRIGGTLLPGSHAEACRQAAAELTKIKNSAGPEALAVLVSPRATMEEGFLAGKFARRVLGVDNVDWRSSRRSVAAAKATDLALSNANGDLSAGYEALILINGDYLHTTPVFAMRLKEYSRVNRKPIIQIGHHHDDYFAKQASHRFYCAPGATAAALHALRDLVAGNESARPEVERLLHASAAQVDGLVGLLKGSYNRALLVQSLDDMNGIYLGEEVPAAIALKQTLGEAWGYIPVTKDRNAVGLYAVGAQAGRGLTAAEEHLAVTADAATLLEKIEGGIIKGLLVLGADALHQFGDQGRVLAALDRLESFVISDLFDSEYTRKATVFLAAASNLERDGTYADVEGNLARLCAAEDPVGGARPDWESLTAIARAMGSDEFGYKRISDVFDEMMELLVPSFEGSFDGLLLPGPRNDYSIAAPGGARRRTPEYNPGDYRLDGAHFRWAGKPVEANTLSPEVLPRVSDGEMLITFGRHVQGDDYHLNHASIASILKVPAYVEMHPEDAVAGGFEDNDNATLQINGEIHEVKVLVREGPAPGTLYLPDGLGDTRLTGQVAVLVGRLEKQPAAVLTEA